MTIVGRIPARLTAAAPLFLLALAAPLARPLLAQASSTEAKRWKIHDLQRPSPTVVTPAPAPGGAPSDAVILFDGSSVSQWQATEGGGDAKWTVKDGYMETSPGSGAIKTRKGFGDIQLHVEWASPSQVQGSGQGRGNSGVIIMGKYEVQVLDSYGNRTYSDGQASAVYGQYMPMVNASRPPGEWQTYDIIFRRPRFAAGGKIQRPANVTVVHNGVLVQDHVDLWGETNWLQYTAYSKHADALPLVLQDHANPVKYRNIWLRELPDVPPPAHGPAESVAKAKVPLSLLRAYAGTYEGEAGGADVLLTNGVLQLKLAGSERRLALMPQTQEKFDMRYTAGTVEFTRHAGAPTELHM
ncbi:MAG: family 16 glycoside hydrolase, partial [Gemmatimonadaceae bacterium]